MYFGGPSGSRRKEGAVVIIVYVFTVTLVFVFFSSQLLSKTEQLSERRRLKCVYKVDCIRTAKGIILGVPTDGQQLAGADGPTCLAEGKDLICVMACV